MKHIISNPGGRKRLSEDEKLLDPIPVRFTKKQMDRINRKRAKSGKSFSAYVRDAAYKARVIAVPSKEIMKEIRDFNNLGTNVNTIAKIALRDGFKEIADKANQVLDGLLEILNRARRGLKDRKEASV